MLAKWTNILPLFIVRYFAVRYAERFKVGKLTLAAGPAGVYFEVRR